MYILRIQILQEKNELEKSDEMYLKGIHLNPKEQNQQYIGECNYLVFTLNQGCLQPGHSVVIKRGVWTYLAYFD